MFAMHQVVRVVRDIPGEQVTRGMVGAVVEVFQVPRRAYEVEFTDAEGKTVAQATLEEEDLEAIQHVPSPRP